MDLYFLCDSTYLESGPLLRLTDEDPPKVQRVPVWWMGGVSSMGAACCTHPFDLVKVHLQTQKVTPLPRMVELGVRVAKNDGIIGLYNGLTASLFRQGTYSTARFAIYGMVQSQLACDASMLSVGQKVAISAFAGCLSGFVATPGGKINVRMQDDMRVPREERRNYKHVFDGLMQVYRAEGLQRGLFSGATICMGRATVVTVGQFRTNVRCM